MVRTVSFLLMLGILFASCSKKVSNIISNDRAKVIGNKQLPLTDPKATEVWEPEPTIVTPSETNATPPSSAPKNFSSMFFR